MKAVYMEGPGKVSVMDLPEPQAGEQDVLIRVHRVGLCGTDLQSYRGAAALTNFPLVPGHELGGEVVSCGSAVPEGLFSPGDPVTVKPYFHCGHCYPCSTGRINCCENSRTLGVQLQAGALCEYIAAPYGNVIKCEGLSYGEIALIEPLSVGAHAAARVHIQKGEFVLVFGCGLIGSGVISAASLRGASVIAVDIASGKFETAKAMGAAACVNPQTQNLEEEIARITHGTGVPAAVEAIGLPETMAQAIHAVHFAGRVGYVGYSKQNVELNATLIVKKELTIAGARNALSDEFKTVRENIRTHRSDFKRLISAVYPIDDAPKAFADWDRAPENFLKIQIQIS